jgi:hypothetical protein
LRLGGENLIVCGKDIRVKGQLVRIGQLEAEPFKYVDDPAQVLAGLRESRPRVDIFTFLQNPAETSSKYRYPMEWDNLAVLPISTYERWWTEQLGFKARNKAKQAPKKGVILRETPLDDALVSGIWEIYNETPIRQGRRFPHFGKSLDQVRSMSSTFPESSIFIGAYYEDKLIGFIKLTTDDNAKQAGIMHIVSMIRHRDKAPTNALVARAVQSCADRGISRLVYANFAYGKKERSSLSDFKERNGFSRVDLSRYYVPLTAIGWSAFRLGLHRKFLDRIPGPLAAKYRDLRSSWYRYRFPTSEQDA